MRRLSMRSTAFTAALLLAGASLPGVVLADPSGSVASGPVEVSSAVHADVSPPLRVMAAQAPSAPSAANLRERPLRRIGAGLGSGPDGALQTTSGPLVATTTPTGFAGVGQGDYGFSDQYAPPDTNGAVGATQYVQWVNTDFAVFDKTTGSKLSGPLAGNTLWSGFGGGCQTNNDGDPIVQYDKIANRWIFTQFSISTTPYLQCVAVSTTSDATGTYNRYSFSYGNTQFPDYPKLGVWPDAYYVTFNIFNNGTTFGGAKVCAYDRAAMLAGTAATQQCFQLSTSYGGLLPADLDGASSTLGTSGTGLPPAGSPGVFMNFGSNSLNLWKMHVDWTTSANTTLSGPTNIPVAAFSAACNGGGTCIPQPGTSQKLDSLGDRLMYRLAYRHFADGHDAIVVDHSVSVSGITSVRWYELRNIFGTPSVFQRGTLGSADGIHRWMGSVAMDGSGDIAVGYSASSGSVYPSIRYTGRIPSDALGTMETESILKAGTGSQTANLSRWGDYSAMTVDPTNDCTFWYTNEYLKANGTFNWSTWISSFSFPGCGSPTPLSITTTSLPGGTLNQPYSVTVGATGGATPYSWSISSGSLPPGLSLGPTTGTISGTPTSAATYSFTVRVTDSSTPTAQTATQALTIVVNPASTTGTLSGTVMDATSGAGINGASISITGPSSATTTTGSSGTYSFANVATGTYSVTASATGYTPATATGVSVTAGATTTQNFPLQATGSATVPGQPAPPTASAGPGHGITVTWIAPSTGGSPITGYTLARYTQCSGSPMTIKPGNVLSYKDGSTTKGTSYCYAVAASNSVGTGSPSTQSNTVKAVR